MRHSRFRDVHSHNIRRDEVVQGRGGYEGNNPRMRGRRQRCPSTWQVTQSAD
jgi:hypothetical protein